MSLLLSIAPYHTISDIPEIPWIFQPSLFAGYVKDIIEELNPIKAADRDV